MTKSLQKQDVTQSTVVECLENLTPKQKKFAELYAINGNMTKSILLAGYETTPGNAHALGHALAHNPRVMPAIEYYRALFQEASHYTPEKVIKEWAEMASVDISEFVTDEWDLRPKGQLTAAQKRALVGLEVIEKKDGRTVKPKFAKVEALKELGKLLGMYADEASSKSTGLDITINLGQQVNVSVDTESAPTETEIGHLAIRMRGEHTGGKS